MRSTPDFSSPLNQPLDPRPQVLGIGGSPRKKSNSTILLHRLLKGVEQAGLSSQALELRDCQFQGCIGCERCRKDRICTGLRDGMSLIYPDLIRSQGLVLVSPTHNYNITAWMKAFIDRLYCFYTFDQQCPRAWSSQLAGQGRKAVLGAVCEQENRDDMGFTLEAMRRPLEALGYEIVAELPIFRIFAGGKIAQQPQLLDQAQALGSRLAESLAP
ncbi:flavodoxin family protein [Desulfogranum mediterraneum]|uniref:flavodoxin family protein n=1 Tax=Desulfogranum mediterraneum TaxID=160661 RepID=UPI000415A07E|nr:flavodoxin family protein [Desulfogranum mediterraneum]